MAGMNEFLMRRSPGCAGNGSTRPRGVVRDRRHLGVHPPARVLGLAATLGFLLVLKGSFDIGGVMTREVNDIRGSGW
jgi:hypothetical protein